MRLSIIFACLLATAGLARADLKPLTLKDVSLMLRSGYSSEAVLRELSTRRLVDTFDSETEKKLSQAGASTALLEALRSGQYQLSEAEIAAAKEKLAAQQEAADEMEDAKEPAAARESRSSPPTKVSAPAGSPDVVYRLLKGSLIHWRQGSITHFDDEELEHKKLFLFFFSANWSKPGRIFTTRLAEYYNRVVPQHPELEVIFFSADRSEFAMQTYIGQSSMPWPAVAYDQIPSKAAAMDKEAIRAIPYLILADAAGHVLSTTGSGENSAGPDKVLADLDQILVRGR